MRSFDYHWMEYDEWWHFENHITVVRPDAPPEAQESYARYLKQVEEMYEDDEEI